MFFVLMFREEKTTIFKTEVLFHCPTLPEEGHLSKDQNTPVINSSVYKWIVIIMYCKNKIFITFE